MELLGFLLSFISFLLVLVLFWEGERGEKLELLLYLSLALPHGVTRLIGSDMWNYWEMTKTSNENYKLRTGVFF